MLFYQELYLEQLEGAPAKKKLKNALVFQKQLELAFLSFQPRAREQENEDQTKGDTWRPPEPERQNKRDSKLQEKLEKVDRMVNQLGFHLGTACKKAKVSKQTAKKWLNHRNGDGSLARVRPNAERFSPERLFLLSQVKQFIDEREGNTYLADIQNHLRESGMVHVSLTTVGRWVREHLQYTYKRCKKATPAIT